MCAALPSAQDDHSIRKLRGTSPSKEIPQRSENIMANMQIRSKSPARQDCTAASAGRMLGAVIVGLIAFTAPAPAQEQDPLLEVPAIWRRLLALLRSLTANPSVKRTVDGK